MDAVLWEYRMKAALVALALAGASLLSVQAAPWFGPSEEASAVMPSRLAEPVQGLPLPAVWEVIDLRGMLQNAVLPPALSGSGMQALAIGTMVVEDDEGVDWTLSLDPGGDPEDYELYFTLGAAMLALCGRGSATGGAPRPSLWARLGEFILRAGPTMSGEEHARRRGQNAHRAGAARRGHRGHGSRGQRPAPLSAAPDTDMHAQSPHQSGAVTAPGTVRSPG